LGQGLMAAAVVSLIGAGIVVWKLPARHGAAPEAMAVEPEMRETYGALVAPDAAAPAEAE
jgi:hypothetical protein